MALRRLRLNHRALTNPPPLTRLFSSSSDLTTTPHMDVKVSSGKGGGESERVVKMEESEAQHRLGTPYEDLRQSLLSLRKKDTGLPRIHYRPPKDSPIVEVHYREMFETYGDSNYKFLDARPCRFATTLDSNKDEDTLDSNKDLSRDESEASIKNDVEKEGLPRLSDRETEERKRQMMEIYLLSNNFTDINHWTIENLQRFGQKLSQEMKKGRNPYPIYGSFLLQG